MVAGVPAVTRCSVSRRMRGVRSNKSNPEITLALRPEEKWPQPPETGQGPEKVPDAGGCERRASSRDSEHTASRDPCARVRRRVP